MVALKLCLPGQASGQVHFRKVPRHSKLEQEGPSDLLFNQLNTPAMPPALWSIHSLVTRLGILEPEAGGGWVRASPALFLLLGISLLLFFAESLQQQSVCRVPAPGVGHIGVLSLIPHSGCVILDKLRHLSEPPSHLFT